MHCHHDTPRWTPLVLTLLLGIAGCADGAVPARDVSGDASISRDGAASEECGPNTCEIGETRCAGSHQIARCVRDPDGCGAFERGDQCNADQVCQEGACVAADSCRDGDGDGYGPGCPKGDDCDDDNADIHPGATDSCGDGIDQDCSGTADEGCGPECPSEPCSPGETRCTGDGRVEVCDTDSSGCGVWRDPQECPAGGTCEGGACSSCSDGDGDGYGTNCATGGDCDDSDPNVHEGARELCDSKDNDCDGDIDEDFDRLGETCEVGRGACATTGNRVCSSDGRSTTCDATAGSPSTELCGDGVDNDCDGDTDEGYDVVGEACTRGTGACATSGTFRCDPDDPTATFCDAPPPDSGTTEVCNGEDDDCDGSTDENSVCSQCVDDGFEENDTQSAATDLISPNTLRELRSCGPCDSGFDFDWFTLGRHRPGDSVTVELRQPLGTNQNGQTHANLEIEMYCDGHICDSIRGRTSPISGTFDGVCSGSFSDCSSNSIWTFYVYPRCKDSPDGNPTIGTPYELTRP